MATLLAVAHRAGNSLQRLDAAVDLGVDVIEADVHARHGRLEVRHLKTMGPLPWLWDRWELASATTRQLGLDELLIAAHHGTTFMLDLKGRRAHVGRQVAEILHGYAPERAVLVCSRYWPSLAAFEPVPWVRTVLSARNRLELALLRRRLISGAPHDAVSVHRSLLTPQITADLHRHVALVMTWPVNGAAALEQVRRLSASGPIGVISDRDDVLRRVLVERSPGADGTLRNHKITDRRRPPGTL